MSVEELVKRLRGTHTCDGCGEYVGSTIHDLCDEAADKLEELNNDLSIAQGNTDAAIEDYNNAINALAEKDKEIAVMRERHALIVEGACTAINGRHVRGFGPHSYAVADMLAKRDLELAIQIRNAGGTDG